MGPISERGAKLGSDETAVYFQPFDEYRMQDPKRTVVAGHVYSQGDIEPFHFTLADDKAVVISKHGIRQLLPHEYDRETSIWLERHVETLLELIKDSPAELHPPYEPSPLPPSQAYRFVKGVANKPKTHGTSNARKRSS